MKKILTLAICMMLSTVAFSEGTNDVFDLKFIFGIHIGADAVGKYSKGEHKFEKPFRGFTSYSIGRTMMNKVGSVCLNMEAEEYTAKSINQELDKLKSIFESKYKIKFKNNRRMMTENPSPHNYIFGNNNIEIMIYSWSKEVCKHDGKDFIAKSRPYRITVSIASKRQIKQDEEAFALSNGEKTFDIPEGQDADML